MRATGEAPSLCCKVELARRYVSHYEAERDRDRKKRVDEEGEIEKERERERETLDLKIFCCYEVLTLAF